MNTSGLGLLTRGFACKVQTITKPSAQGSSDVQAVSARTVSSGAPPNTTKSLGIFQSDIIIKSAIDAALSDLRNNPWLLDYVFSSLPQDALTWKEYGEKSVQTAKSWFLKTAIPVKLVPVLNELQVPCITISLLDSSEVTGESSLGDIHFESTEAVNSTWPPLTTVFAPKSYQASTGVVVLKSLPETVSLQPGMFIIDANGKEHEILKVTGDLTFEIAANTVANFKKSVLKSHKPSIIVNLESSFFRESYRIGIHVGGEPGPLSWVHSIVVFALLRYKQALLEARGFERSSFQSSDFSREQQYETEMVFSRYITITGNVKQYWPKYIGPVIDGVKVDVSMNSNRTQPDENTGWGTTE